MQIEEGVGGCNPPKPKASEICIILHIIRKPNSIIVLLFVQNISRALQETKCTLLSSVTNSVQRSQHHDNIFAVNSNTDILNLKINEISIFVAFCVFLLSLSFNFYLVRPFKSEVSHFRALWLCCTNAVIA